MSFKRATAQYVTDTAQVRAIARVLRGTGAPVVLVPVLGDEFHAGHYALIRAARRIPGAVTVVATTVGMDVTQQLLAEKVDVHYAYDVAALWPQGPRSLIAPVDRGLGDPAEVALAVSILVTLINVVGPSDIVVVEGDYEVAVGLQQVITDWHLPVKLHAVPVVRTAEGVPITGGALRATEAEWEHLIALSAALTAGAHAADQGATAVVELVRGILQDAGVSPAYLAVRGRNLGEAPAVGDGRLLAGLRLSSGALVGDTVGLPLGIGFKNLEGQ